MKTKVIKNFALSNKNCYIGDVVDFNDSVTKVLIMKKLVEKFTEVKIEEKTIKPQKQRKRKAKNEEKK